MAVLHFQLFAPSSLRFLPIGLPFQTLNEVFKILIIMYMEILKYVIKYVHYRKFIK